MNSLFRLIGFTIFCILLIGGLLTSVFAHSIEAALTVPANRTASPVNVPKTTTPTPAAVITAGTNPTAVPVNILAQDTFQRADQLLWGTASDGQTWGGDATNKAVFSIATMTGQAANGQGGFNATLGPMITDAEVQFSGSMNQFKQSNFGALLRWTDANDWYKAYIDGANLILLKNMAGMATRLGAVPFKAIARVAYTLRFRVSGTSLSAKAWQTGNPEPANWMVTATDTSFQGGFGGLRFLLKNGIVARITLFKETTITPNQ
jgi:hypothetical protein